MKACRHHRARAIAALAAVAATGAPAVASASSPAPAPQWRIELGIGLGAGGDPGLGPEVVAAFFDRARGAVADRRAVLRARLSPSTGYPDDAPVIVAVATARDRAAARSLADRLLDVALDAGFAALPADAELGWTAYTGVRRAR